MSTWWLTVSYFKKKSYEYLSTSILKPQIHISERNKEEPELDGFLQLVPVQAVGSKSHPGRA